MRHFGHGIGWFVTQAAKSSWDLRSATETVAVGPGAGTFGATEEGGDAGAAIAPLRALDRRPHSGQTTRPFEPVDWSATWQ